MISRGNNKVDKTDELLKNLDKIHTTQIGMLRIKRNLSLDTDDVVEWCKKRISSLDIHIKRKGKNYYISAADCIITVNVCSYTIITAHKNGSEKHV